MEPLPPDLDPDARAALTAAGGRLMEQLDALREGGRTRGALLPAGAKLALDRHGDALLDGLGARRRSARRSAAVRRWCGRLAKLAALGVAVALALEVAVPTAPAPPVATVEPAPVADGSQLPIHGYSPVPEPGTGALSVVGALLLALRRRRPATS